MFLGFETYNCKLDNKFRILVPTKFRKDNEELIREGFVIKRSLSFQCLELYPYSEWKNQVAMLNRLNPFDKRATDFKILYTAGVRTVELDGSNRILIPKELVNAGNLQKEVYLIPLGTYYQIWDKDAYEQHLAGNKGVNLNDAYSDVISELGAINDSLNNK